MKNIYLVILLLSISMACKSQEKDKNEYNRSSLDTVKVISKSNSFYIKNILKIELINKDKQSSSVDYINELLKESLYNNSAEWIRNELYTHRENIVNSLSSYELESDTIILIEYFSKGFHFYNCDLFTTVNREFRHYDSVLPNRVNKKNRYPEIRVRAIVTAIEKRVWESLLIEHKRVYGSTNYHLITIIEKDKDSCTFISYLVENLSIGTDEIRFIRGNDNRK